MTAFRRVAKAVFRGAVVSYLAWQCLFAVWILTTSYLVLWPPLRWIDPLLVSGVTAGLISASLGLFEFWRAYHKEGPS